MKPQTIEDIERAAWYARLAFGDCSEKAITPPITPEKTRSVFQVTP